MADDKILSLLAGENAGRAAEGRARRGTDGGGEGEAALERPAFHEPADEARRKGVPGERAISDKYTFSQEPFVCAERAETDKTASQAAQAILVIRVDLSCDVGTLILAKGCTLGAPRLT